MLRTQVLVNLEVLAYKVVPDDLEQLGSEYTSRYLESTWLQDASGAAAADLFRGPATEEQPWSPSSPERVPWARLEALQLRKVFPQQNLPKRSLTASPVSISLPDAV